MRVFDKRLILTLTGLLVTADMASAKHQITKIVKKNTQTYITDNFAFGDDCTPVKNFAAYGGTVSAAPSNGFADAVYVFGSVSQKKLNLLNPAFKCDGRKTWVTYVRYTPRRNYTGPDQITVQWRGGAVTYSFTVQ